MAQKPIISDLLLEQYSLGELPSNTERMIRAEMERDETLRVRLEALEESNREILADYPPQRIVPAIRERLRQSHAAERPRKAVFPFAVALPAAAVILLFFSFFIARERIFPGENRLKGISTHITVYRGTSAGAEELASGSIARSADVLQLSYTAGDARYGTIFSVDGRGAVTWHLPAGYAGGLRQSPSLEQQGTVILPSAYELDDAPGFERFFIAFSQHPFDLLDIEKAVQALAFRPGAAETERLALPQGVKQFSIVLKKKG